jgi:hypothetical protein
MRYLSFCAAMGLLFLAGCRPDAPVVSNSVEVISVDPAYSEAVNRAVVDAHRELANWIVDGDKKSDPTYGAGSRVWKTGDGTDAKKDTKMTCSRGFIEFRTAKDVRIRIETVFVADRSLTVLINCDNEEEILRVHKAVLEKIRSQCGFVN